MQQSQTAHLPAIASDLRVVVQAVLAMALGPFHLSAWSASRTSARFITPRTMSATPLRFPVTLTDHVGFHLCIFGLASWLISLAR